MTVLRLDANGPQGLARSLRALAPGPDSVGPEVERLIAAVRDGGHAELERLARRYDGLPEGEDVVVEPDRCLHALASLDPAVRSGLERAIANVGAVAADLVPQGTLTALPEGHTVELRELPVAAAGVYAPGGRNPYPSTVVMGSVTARAAGVGRVVVCVPGAHPVMLAACALCEVDEVWQLGGAQAIAALAFGTERLAAVDVVAGPGNLYVQEAKRRLAGDSFGIDGFAGPSDLLVLAGPDADEATVAADMLAQAEHGAGSVVGLLTDDEGLAGRVTTLLERGAPEQGLGALAVAVVDGPDQALATSELFAPEHLSLVGRGMEELAGHVTRAGAVFVGPASAVAFGDYVAGSNHTLPTAGAARFASVLSPRTFRRIMTVVKIPASAGEQLAAAAVPIAEAEGFGRHACSMRLRQNQDS